ncbi:hypothetical protein ACFVHI_34185, partial [Kitasatospora sp. NPDC127121]|uniref:hypothetical protein n=1 Tax=Kitasatospora sp. NPDC127121 TaxID=3345371 RepID=UPI003626AF46
HGQKSNFGFMFHEDGEEPDPNLTSQFRIPGIPGRGPFRRRRAAQPSAARVSATVLGSSSTGQQA